MTSFSTKQKRTAFTDEHKRRIRAFYQANADSTSQKDVITWAKKNDLHNPHAKRHKPRQYKVLEDALYEWIKALEKKIFISGELIRFKAGQFFKELKVYQGMEEPGKSSG
ncbi:hypothetical protein EJ08DRAFT_714449 [Tothia fuscella]|uniref:HTH CENPB-type domain-containing protein n=1 Tax=Tothia fuscella TaxID=1048955 RepID=A0A9P4NS70_9PEZI|nr:hypothetical protein EJ08DRAFT_714449 [Tothia fuscella]